MPGPLCILRNAAGLSLREISSPSAGLVLASATGMALMPAPAPGYHDAVSEFKRRLIEATLLEARGNRTHAAKTLGLQRTYLLPLIRDLGVAAPPPRRRNGAA